ncbi:MAG: TAXI family TRAP transporter solute-binding subunit, partial [Thermodesulfobacteriota bacterium]|nr:TAXI family TRAP transporter solute-binding subunit [Thermodesulfobacteriota bacterium]
MMKKKSTVGMLAISLVLAIFFACGPKAAAQAKVPKVMDLLMGSTSTTSGYYPGAVALAKIFNENVPGLRVTVVETGATHDNLMRVKKGHLHFASVTCPEGTVMAYYGTHRWKGAPWPKYRILNHYTIINQSYAVRADSGIKTIGELHGKKFHFGIPGSATEYNATIVFEALGIKPERVLGSLGDAVAMTKDGRVVGFVKSTPIKVLDSSIADVRS